MFCATAEGSVYVASERPLLTSPHCSRRLLPQPHSLDMDEGLLTEMWSVIDTQLLTGSDCPGHRRLKSLDIGILDWSLSSADLTQLPDISHFGIAVMLANQPADYRSGSLRSTR